MCVCVWGGRGGVKNNRRCGTSESAMMRLPGLSSNQPEVQIIEEGRSLVAHGDPVLID